MPELTAAWFGEADPPNCAAVQPEAGRGVGGQRRNGREVVAVVTMVIQVWSGRAPSEPAALEALEAPAQPG